MTNPRTRAIILVALITFAASVTPIAIRITQAQGIPSLAIVFMRLFIGALAMTPYIWSRYQPELKTLRPTDWGWAFGAGFWLAMNLIALFYALEFTSVLITGVLRRTTPVWIILPEIIFLGAVFSWRMWSSVALSVIGVVIITFGSVSGVGGGSNPFLGAFIAIGGSIFIGIYLLIGRRLSTRLPSLVYSWLVFACAAVVVLIVVLITRTPLLGYSWRGYGWVLIVTVLSQYIGHISINFGLRYFSATAMSIILELSVVLGAVLAFLQFGEIPTPLQIMGSALIIFGLVLTSTEKRVKA